MPALLNTSISSLHSLTEGLNSAANRTNETFTALPTDGDCNQASLSAGSAAFILIALILGCMTQPAGSLVTHTGNRFWRVSPFLNALESMIIFGWLFVPAIHDTRTFIGRRLPKTWDRHIAAGERYGDMSLKVAAYIALAQRLGNSRDQDLWAKQQYGDQTISVEDIKELTAEVENMEKGKTLRPAIILPMVLQFFKIIFIKSMVGNAWKIWPLLYFFSWLSVEVLLWIVHGSPLEEAEFDQVQSEIIELLAVTEVQGQGRPFRPVVDTNSTTGTTSSSNAATSWDSRGLLAQPIPLRTRPHHQLYFRGKRRSLKSLEGNPSGGFLMILAGRIFVVAESYCHMLPLLLWVDMPAGWHIFVYMFLSLGPLVIFDILAGFLIMSLQKKYGKPEAIPALTPQAGMRDFVNFKTAVIWIVYYLCIYTGDGLLKPAWLDWLG